MGVFSNDMKKLVVDLTKQLGNPCVLTKVVKGVYDPLTGVTPPASTQTISTYSAPASMMSETFGRDGENTNLDGFNSESVLIPYFAGLDKGWLFDGQNIMSIAPIKTQGDIVAYNISIGRKE